MNDQGVPGTTHIRTRSIGNVETARLMRRLAHLDVLIHSQREWCERRIEFRQVVVEAVKIENELCARGVKHLRVTRRTW